MNDASHFDHTALHDKAAEAIDAKAIGLLNFGTSKPFQNRAPDPFPTRQEMETITAKDIIGEPKLAYTDITGRTIARYFARDGHEIGLFDEGYKTLRRLVEQILKTKPFNEGFSPEFLEEKIFEWWMKSYGENSPPSLSEHLVAEASEVFGEHHLMIPIAALEIQKPFRIGDVRVAPVDKQMLINRAKAMKQHNPNEAEIIDKTTSKFVREWGHYTGVYVQVVGEIGFAKSHAKRRAFQIAEMFRFMSPAALTWNVAYPCYPHGCHHNRTMTTTTISDGMIGSISRGLLDSGMFIWRVTSAEFDRDVKAGFAHFVPFFQEGTLTPFQERVARAISAFSEGVGSHNVNDRLKYAMSSLEHLFLRNEQEPIQSSVGDRIAFLVEKDPEKRREIVSNFKKSYAIRSKQVHHLSTVDDEETLSVFFRNAWIALIGAMGFMRKFDNYTDFLDAIDSVKYGGGE